MKYLLDTCLLSELIRPALSNGLTVVTRNSKDIEASGANCINPWK